MCSQIPVECKLERDKNKLTLVLVFEKYPEKPVRVRLDPELPIPLISDEEWENFSQEEQEAVLRIGIAQSIKNGQF